MAVMDLNPGDDRPRVWIDRVFWDSRNEAEAICKLSRVFGLVVLDTVD